MRLFRQGVCLVELVVSARQKRRYVAPFPLALDPLMLMPTHRVLIPSSSSYLGVETEPILSLLFRKRNFQDRPVQWAAANAMFLSDLTICIKLPWVSGYKTPCITEIRIHAALAAA
jgi:hypothetical protein